MKKPVTNYSENYFTNVTVKSNAINKKYVAFLSDIGVKLSGKSICDIGCADGSFLGLLQKNKSRYGCDISGHIIKEAQRNLPDISMNLKVHDLNKEPLPFKTTFDLITMFDVIEHISNHIPLAKSISSNLKKGGYFLITTPNAQSFLRFLALNSFTGEVDKTHTMLFTPYTLDFYLRRLGLKKVILSTPYSFYFKNNFLTQNILFGGQIFALYRKE